ncbi:hypothetical protein ACFX15_018936 [Malus domestica]
MNTRAKSTASGPKSDSLETYSYKQSVVVAHPVLPIIDFIDTFYEPLVESVTNYFCQPRTRPLLVDLPNSLFQLSVPGEESSSSYHEDDLKCDANPMAFREIGDKELLDLVDKEDPLVGLERICRSLSYMY